MKAWLFAALRRLTLALVIVWGATSSVWAAMALIPGDAMSVRLGPNASPADVARARELYGLDQPLHQQYARFLRRLVHRGPGLPEPGAGPRPEHHRTCAELGGGVHVDLGESVRYHAPVVDLVQKRLPRSLSLAVAALAVQLALGLGLGALAAVRRGRPIDQAVVLGVSALTAAPTFVTGLVLQYVLAVRLGWLPLDGASTSPPAALSALVLPALTLGLYGAAIFTRVLRVELGDALRETYVQAARAKGASPARAAWRHALPNAVGPVAQLSVLELGSLIGGAIVTEKLFRWPGLGELSVTAIQSRDAALLVGITLISATAIVLSTLLADLLSLALDPRLRRPADKVS